MPESAGVRAMRQERGEESVMGSVGVRMGPPLDPPPSNVPPGEGLAYCGPSRRPYHPSPAVPLRPPSPPANPLIFTPLPTQPAVPSPLSGLARLLPLDALPPGLLHPPSQIACCHVTCSTLCESPLHALVCCCAPCPRRPCLPQRLCAAPLAHLLVL